MKKLFIIANWKSHKTTSEASEWLEKVESSKVQDESKNVIVCASFTLLPVLRSSILNLKSGIRLGAQDISPFAEGSYTGAVNGKQIAEFAEYVIVGHAEQRKYFGQTDHIREEKVKLAKQNGLQVIFCAQSADDVIPQGVEIVAYDPAFAIGTGSPDSPESAQEVATNLKQKFSTIRHVLYGGSVASSNVHLYTKQSDIDGVLVGGKSLDPGEFAHIIHNA